VLGLKSLFRGIGFLVTTPGAWPYALVPLFVMLLLVTLLGSASIEWVPGLIRDWVGPGDSGWAEAGATALAVLGTVLAVLLSGLLAFALAQPLSGPALEKLVRMHEQKLGADERAPTNFVADIFRSLKSVAMGYAIGLPLIAMLLVLSLLLPFASVVTVPLKLLVACFTIAWDICDSPLAIRGMRVRDRVRVLWRYRGAVAGFAIGMALAGLVPCLAFFFLPAGVAGAGRLMWEVELYERSGALAAEGATPLMGR
jgi:CysZ protein